MNLVFEEKAQKRLKKFSPEVSRKIIAKLGFFISAPSPLEFAERLINNDAGQYRFRIGDYRVIFDVEEDTIVVLTLGHRREIYK
ncbi:MAG: Addiction module toxin, RelE/StbE family [Candidatus Amesbacteria bacterium GW2011_GWA2_47_70]|uniref:Addiction module toxin, RelE/StbE family n=1 Tax=Candidatus Amesbacteria bacterium GW2011_GWC2_45_19 TaxID=1618366 RepID=A0A0G1M3J9_9BACT|nr:MAG: Addiction module toxin, RelE/StbE family [Candidatus Amesbacteria bacterium GW2011_GWC2_45_19]KKU68354.1 MAG: addiction module antitoxin [Microgenomates group bacterium GW2011_GWC1_47_20]KKU78887.1 MAG: Addiction module toxin, RelE/StbE family [Candidatus Amesbacteria bacterium GW2011_GWA2_47_70]